MNVNEAIESVINAKLELIRERGESLNIATCLEVYQTIFTLIENVLLGSNTGASNETANYIAQSYYDNVAVNDREGLNPHIFTQRAKLENIESRDLIVLLAFFRGTDAVKPIIAELKRRN